MYIDRHWNDIQSYINGLFYETEYTIHENYQYDPNYNYIEVYYEPCDVSTTAKPLTKSNISADQQHPYYAYTDSKGRVVHVEAEYIEDKGERSGRLCDAMYPSNQNQTAKEAIGYITNSDDNRGHLIGDRFDGVSNAYNITAQHEITNQKEYSSIEDDIANFLNNGYKITDFMVDVQYKTITDRRPQYYNIYFKVNGRAYQYRLYNDGSPLTTE